VCVHIHLHYADLASACAVPSIFGRSSDAIAQTSCKVQNICLPTGIWKRWDLTGQECKNLCTTRSASTSTASCTSPLTFVWSIFFVCVRVRGRRKNSGTPSFRNHPQDEIAPSQVRSPCRHSVVQPQSFPQPFYVSVSFVRWKCHRYGMFLELSSKTHKHALCIAVQPQPSP